MTWEARYQAGDTPWDKGYASPGLLEFLQTHPPLNGAILVPGCGFGHDVRALARPENHVVGIDLAPSAVAGANAFPKVAGEQYELADLFELPAKFHGAFDWVWEHTCFCAIHPESRGLYAESIRTALKPGGHFLGILYINPDHDEEGPPFRVSSAELDELFGPYFQTLQEWEPTRAYPGREGRERMRLMVKKG